jgi:hypothetical protein
LTDISFFKWDGIRTVAKKETAYPMAQSALAELRICIHMQCGGATMHGIRIDLRAAQHQRRDESGFPAQEGLLLDGNGPRLLCKDRGTNQNFCSHGFHSLTLIYKYALANYYSGPRSYHSCKVHVNKIVDGLFGGSYGLCKER